MIRIEASTTCGHQCSEHPFAPIGLRLAFLPPLGRPDGKDWPNDSGEDNRYIGDLD